MQRDKLKIGMQNSLCVVSLFLISLQCIQQPHISKKESLDVETSRGSLLLINLVIYCKLSIICKQAASPGVFVLFRGLSIKGLAGYLARSLSMGEMVPHRPQIPIVLRLRDPQTRPP